LDVKKAPNEGRRFDVPQICKSAGRDGQGALHSTKRLRGLVNTFPYDTQRPAMCAAAALRNHQANCAEPLDAER
jgi:hypothetical protein